MMISLLCVYVKRNEEEQNRGMRYRRKGEEKIIGWLYCEHALLPNRTYIYIYIHI